MPTTAPVHWIGLDVSSTDAAVAVPGQQPRKFPLSADGAAALLAWARRRCPAGAQPRCVMEHTGVYSQAWAALLEAAGAPCAVCNPARIRRFAQASGQRSKTDTADARSILAYAQHAQPPARTLPPPAQQQLAQLLSLRRALGKAVQQWANRAHALACLPHAAPQLALVEALAAAQRQALAQADAALERLLREDPALASASVLLQSIPGIARCTAAVLCGMLSELESYSPAQLSALAGLAPAHHQSGHSVRGRSRIDKQGRPQLRCALYMAALSAARFCPPLAALRDRLRARGKPPKVILCAVARKLLLLAQAVLKSGQPFASHLSSA